MNIAIIDIAATTGGAVSVLNDLLYYIRKDRDATKHRWYIFTSLIDIEESDNIKNIKYPKLKCSWLSRMKWEYFELSKILKGYHIDIVISLQNNGLPVQTTRQYVFFHNLMLVQTKHRFSPWNVVERADWIYSFLLSRYIRWSWRYADNLVVQGLNVKELSSSYFCPDNISICHCWSTFTYDNQILHKYSDNNSLNQYEQANGSCIRGYIYPAGAASYKNHEIICKAIKIIEGKGLSLEIIFTITGNENAYANKIKALASETNGIRLVGGISRLKICDYLKSYGVIMTSKVESCGLPIVEGITAGAVVVAEDRPYVREIINSYSYPRLHLGNGTVESLVDAILAGLQDHTPIDMDTHFNSINKDIVNNGYIKLIRDVCSDKNTAYN